MTPERWQEVKKVLAGALERKPEDRSAYLSQACTDPDLRREVESLIAAHEQDLTTLPGLPAVEKNDLLKSGTKLGPYTILGRLGAGGMGVVYRARDERLERDVAIKVLPLGLLADEAARKRFHKEALALAKLNHPNIAAVHDVGEQDGADYLVMECVPGESLAEKLRSGSLPEEQVVLLGAQIAAAMEEAHEHDIVHRDLKPGNIMVTPKGQIKVLDFGLAKLLRPFAGSATTETFAETLTMAGTLPYMAPEQLRGEPVDARTDIHALGAVLYEMAVGRRPFQEDSPPRLTDAILHQPPVSLRALHPDVSPELERIVMRCLAKKREARYSSAGELHRELEACQARPVAWTWRVMLRQPALAATVLAIFIAAGVLGFRGYVRASRAKWAEREALPKVAQLMNADQLFAALRLLREAEPYAQSSPEMIRERGRLFVSSVSIQTTPPGAEIYVGDYLDAKNDNDSSRWELLGRSPLQTDRLPIRGYYRVRAIEEGFEPVEWAFVNGPNTALELLLHSRNVVPDGMVWVPGAHGEVNDTFPAPPAEFSGYWLDKYEVTNRQFKEFVDHGGYRKQEYWKQPFIQGGRALPWEQAMADFRDKTGRPGPATWEFGTYPDGKADFPVGGVSWYEAAAYAEFAGKSLPTVYHWYRAAGLGSHSDILTLSNFAGQGPARVGSYSGLGPFGTYDMAGNVKEWSSNPTGDRRYILGGAWNEPSYMYLMPDARKPFDRAASFGFRCVKYVVPLPVALTGPVQFPSRDRRSDKPADDQAFQIYQRLHSYDKTDLKPAVESVDESSPYWRVEKITFQAAYGDERVLVHLYLPKNATPPYQVVAYFPGASALTARSVEELGDPFEFVVRSGRALIFPTYKGMLERGPGAYYHQLGQPNLWRDMNLQWSKDLGRSLDYLATRQDIDIGKLAYYGFSLGGAMGPRLIAVEPRFNVAMLLSGGSFDKVPAEVDSWNFASRVKIPVLMLNGRDDFRFPVETSQVPLFRLLGTPEKDKRHVLYDGGHDNLLTRPDLIKQILDWLDAYLGPVKSLSGS